MNTVRKHAEGDRFTRIIADENRYHESGINSLDTRHRVWTYNVRSPFSYLVSRAVLLTDSSWIDRKNTLPSLLLRCRSRTNEKKS